MTLAGTVVVLNGPPSAGNRSIIRRILETADSAFLSVGIDLLYKWMIPELRAGQEDRRTKGYFALGAYQPSARRIYQPAALP